MARNIQPSHRGNIKLGAVLGPLVAAIFWIVIAVNFPVRLIPQLVPALAPYAEWVVPVFYILAFWGFLRAARGVKGIAGNRRSPANRGSRVPQTRPQQARPQQAGAKSAAANRAMPAIDRRPTVQRMR